jgi:hypothetical protein
MSPVEKLEQDIQKLRDSGNHDGANRLQLMLDSHNAAADLADQALLDKQRAEREAMGF